MAKAYAVAALDLLRLNNAQAYKHILDKGGMQMLEGLKQYGVGLGRNQALCGWPARPQPLGRKSTQVKSMPN